MMAGMQRVFARAIEDAATLTLFHRVGFQRYAQELLYVRANPVVEPTPEPLRGLGQPKIEIRRWHGHDAWALTRLHDVTTPRKVQVAEHMSSEELARQLVPRTRAWHIPGIEPRDESYVVDIGSRLAAWVRVRQGWAGLPHQLWLTAHPDNADITDQVIQFALQRLCQQGIMPGAFHRQTPVICQIRDYDSPAIDGLRRAGFTHTATKAMLVRHLTLRTFSEALPAVEQSRINYGVEGLGAVRSAPIQSTREMLNATHDH
jgi:hypothetical protein